MIKDAEQKRRAISYCVANGIVPFLEVVVQNETDTNDIKSDLTDLDVLGLHVVGCDRPRRIVFDCKTQKGVSPINRAFWARGAMAYTGCQEAFVILGKSASEGHRLAAKRIDVHLFDEKLFDHYATATSSKYLANPSYLCRLGVWDQWARIHQQWPRLALLMWNLTSAVPLETNHVRALRILVGSLSRLSGELDPAKAAHVSVFFNWLSCMSLCMTQIVGDLRNVFDPQMDLNAFDKLCKRYVWEGKDNYEVRNRLHKLTQARHVEKSEGDIEDFSLPGWMTFLEMTRTFLEAPTTVGLCALPLRELGFRALAGRDDLGDTHVQDLLASSGRVLQFCLSLSGYAVRGIGLPREFSTIAATTINEVRISKTDKLVSEPN